MTGQVASPTPPPRLSASARTRGKRAGITRREILDAARDMEPGTLTMGSLARKLGVDPKALNHHVRDRVTLLKLLAEEQFMREFVSSNVRNTGGWRDACRAYAASFTTAAVALGDLLAHFDADGALTEEPMVAAEDVLTKLSEAGFSDEASMRAIALLTNICMGFARDLNALKRLGERPRQLMLSRTLVHFNEDAFPRLRSLAGSPSDTYTDGQLEFSVELFIRGLESAT